KGLVYCMSGYLGYSINAISLSAEGDINGSDKIAWHFDKAAPYVASPLLYHNLLYFTKGENPILFCLDAGSGAVIYGDQRLADMGAIYSSPVGAAGRIYITGRSGMTVVIGNGQTFETLAVNQLDEPISASLVPVGKDLLVRGDKHLYAIQEN